MYPFIEIFPWLSIYTFGLTLTLCFFVFLWNLKRLSGRFGYSFALFSQNIVWFFLSTFFFSRLFYVIARWNDMRFINDPFQFFIMSEFNFSLFGAIFGFLLVLGILVRLERGTLTRYIDGLVVSFFAILVVGYIGSLFGGQVYGRETAFGIELMYKNPYTPVPYQVPIFPLPIVYAFVSFVIFSGLYILSLFTHIRGFIGYIGLILFGAMILIFEFFSGKQDILSIRFMLNLPQIYALIIIAWAGYHVFSLFSRENNSSSSHVTS